MRISLNFIVRISGMLILAFLGSSLGIGLSSKTPDENQLLATQLLMLSGAGLGLLVTPRLTIEPVQNLLNHTRSIPLNELLFVGSGGLLGLIFGVLLTIPLALLPQPLNQYIPIIASIMSFYAGIMIFHLHKRDMDKLALLWQANTSNNHLLPVGKPSLENPETKLEEAPQFLLDTSAIIDGRIAEVIKTGFLTGTLLVPNFVLAELQSLADSSDDLRRNKGRRGLDLLNQMQENGVLPVKIISADVASAARVDDKLVLLAKRNQQPIITNDFNLNRVAVLQGVKILNLNQLSEAVRPPVLQDQHLFVLIRNEGNARQQGVGYLEDGTPVIVEDARHKIGEQVEAVVTRLHQTQTGRLVFAQMCEEPLR